MCRGWGGGGPAQPDACPPPAGRQRGVGRWPWERCCVAAPHPQWVVPRPPRSLPHACNPSWRSFRVPRRIWPPPPENVEQGPEQGLAQGCMYGGPARGGVRGMRCGRTVRRCSAYLRSEEPHIAVGGCWHSAGLVCQVFRMHDGCEPRRSGLAPRVIPVQRYTTISSTW